MVKKAKPSKKAKAAAAVPQVVQRYVSPDRVAERQAQGFTRVEGAHPLRNGSVLMEKKG